MVLCLVTVLFASGCGTTQTQYSGSQPGITAADAEHVAGDQEARHRATDYEATTWAEINEDREIEAWNRNLADIEAEGQDAASDPSLDDSPEAYDCEDFAFKEAAVAFFEGAGGPEEDQFWLDDDEDGEPCELLARWEPGVDWTVGL